MATHPRPYRTFEEYLELERRAEFKNEYHAAEIFAMAGGTLNHSRPSIQTAVALFHHFKDCQLYGSDLKLYIRQADRCFYPDAMMLCGEPEFHEGQQDVIVNPSLVVEVLSPSTQHYYKGPKTGYYRTVPSIEHLLLVAQDSIFIEHFAPANGTWIITAYRDRTNSIPLMGTGLPVTDVYGGIL